MEMGVPIPPKILQPLGVLGSNACPAVRQPWARAGNMPHARGVRTGVRRRFLPGCRICLEILPHQDILSRNLADAPAAERSRHGRPGCCRTDLGEATG